MFEDKISQVVQLTGKTKDEVVIALYDCDNDPNRAVNMLLEGDDQASNRGYSWWAWGPSLG